MNILEHTITDLKFKRDKINPIYTKSIANHNLAIAKLEAHMVNVNNTRNVINKTK